MDTIKQDLPKVKDFSNFEDERGLGPGARLDEQMRNIMYTFTQSKQLNSSATPDSNNDYALDGPGAQLDVEIAELKAAVHELQLQRRESSRIKLRNALEKDMKKEDTLFEQKEDTLDRPLRSKSKKESSLENDVEDKEIISRALEKAIGDTAEHLKGVINRGEKTFEEAFKQSEEILMNGMKSLLGQIGVDLGNEKKSDFPAEDSQFYQNTEKEHVKKKKREWV